MWFSASLYFKSRRVTGPEIEGPWEESIILIEAPSQTEAIQMATQIGKRREQQYLAADGFVIKWTFELVERVFELQTSPKHGCELFSRFLRSDDVNNILRPFDDGN
jgi:hypothetical protein